MWIVRKCHGENQKWTYPRSWWAWEDCEGKRWDRKATCFQKKVEWESWQEGEALKADISALESDLKAITKINKIKDKEVHDLNKENKTLSENMENLNMDLKMLAAQVKKFKKDELKKVS